MQAVGLADEIEEPSTGRSLASPAAKQVKQVMEDLVANLLLLSVLRAQRGPQRDPGKDDKHGYDSRDEDKDPLNPWAKLRQQAEEFC